MLNDKRKKKSQIKKVTKAKKKKKRKKEHQLWKEKKNEGVKSKRKTN